MAVARVAVALALALIGLAAPAAHAQAAVQISPVNAERAAQPGDTLHGTITVTNPTGGPIQVRVFPTDFTVRPSGKLVLLPTGSLQRSAGAWIHLSRQSLTLEANGSATVKYDVSVPAGASAGTHWSGIVFRSGGAPSSKLGANSVGIRTVAQDAYVLYLDVGAMKPSASIQSLALSTGGGNGAGEHFTVSLQNGGNAFLNVGGRIEVRSTAGKLVHTYKIPVAASLPGLARDFSVPVTPSLDPGTYLVTCLLHDGTGTVISGQTQVTVP